jgi:glycerophosphoryl diester phosphodiesterase
MIEIKTRGIVQRLIDFIRAMSPTVPIWYASYFHSELLIARNVDETAITVALMDGVPVESTAFANDARATIAGIAKNSLEPEFVRDLKKAGFRVITFTIDDPQDIQYAKSLQLYGLISNFPDRLI